MFLPPSPKNDPEVTKEHTHTHKIISHLQLSEEIYEDSIQKYEFTEQNEGN